MLERKEDFFSAGSFNAHPFVTLIWKSSIPEKPLVEGSFWLRIGGAGTMACP